MFVCTTCKQELSNITNHICSAERLHRDEIHLKLILAELQTLNAQFGTMLEFQRKIFAGLSKLLKGRK
jgi:hypothetical protein